MLSNTAGADAPGNHVNHSPSLGNGNRPAKVSAGQNKAKAAAEAAQFLELLGKDPAQTYFRTIRHGEGAKGANRSRRGRDLHGFDLEALTRDNLAGESIYFVTGNSTTATSVNQTTGKPTGCVCEKDITTCPALFAEWDDKPMEWQLQAWRELGLPEPSIQLLTGGKSVHCYWLLDEPMEKAQWRELQARLIDHCGSDEKCKDPNRLMRLPGFAYIDKKTGKPTGKVAEVVHTTGNRYSPQEIAACLPSLFTAPQAPPAPAQPTNTAHNPRPLEQIQAACAHIPERVVGGNTYEPSRRALCGCAAALAEIGLPEEQALDLLANKWPDRATAKQALQSSKTREAKSFWSIASEYGFELRRSATNNVVEIGSRQAQRIDSNPFEPANTGGQNANPRELSFEEKWQALESHAETVSGESWPLMKATASLASRAGELDLHRLTARNFEQLLEGAQRRQRPTAKALEPGDTFTVLPTPWAVEGIFRHGLNLLVGAPGAGKSRLAAAAIAAWLRGDRDWLGRPMPCDLPIEERHALIVGTDQGAEDWALTLEPVGLVFREGPTRVQLHPRITLHTLETGTALDADGLATIRRWCDAHPHGAVLVDSLAATLPPGIDEDKSAAARPVHALAEALGSCWSVLTHHMRKGAGKEQNLGVGAGRGSSAIDGAVSRVIGLGLIQKMEGGLLVPQEADPRRELLSTKRGGATLHLVIRSDASGFWSNEGSAADLKRQERKERTIANLTERQAAVVEALEDATDWLTGRQVAEALLEPGDTYDARGSHAATTRKTLGRLDALGLIETKRVGLERLYRLPDPLAQSQQGESQCEPLRVEENYSTGSNGSNTAAQGITQAHPVALTGSDRLSPVVPALEPVRTMVEPVGEPVRTTAAQYESHSSHPPSHPLVDVALTGSHPFWLPDLLAIREANPGQPPSIYANELMAKHQAPTDGRTVKALLKAWDANPPKTVGIEPG